MKVCPHCTRGNPPEAKLCSACNQPFDVQHGSAANADATIRWTGMPPAPGKAGMRRSISIAEIFARKTKLSIGRAPDCDLILAHPLISRHHAELERLEDGRLRLTDLGSMNGITFGGHRLTGSSLVSEDVPVGIGPFMFSLIGQTICTIDNSQGLRLEARGLEKTVPQAKGPSRKLLDNINLVIEPGEFVSVLGPSGSGKSTLMDCLNGRRRATGGQVLANGQDFYGHFDNFRQSLGYVPQKDIVHSQLTVARALYYTARLRLPTDTTAKELESRMKDVIKLMELEPHRDTLVANLSGGQIKRVSLGAELLARPSLLYIDEATSGLDAGTEARMMKLFRSLADEGKSLICITHNVDNVDSCHLLIVLARGKLVYFGPPSEARTYFKVARISEIYDRLAERDIDAWEKDYAGCSLHAEFVAKRVGSATDNDAFAVPPSGGSSVGTVEPPRGGITNDGAPKPPRSRFTPWWHQLKVLTQRYAELVLTDRRSLKLFLLQAPLIALFLLAGFIGKPFQQKLPVPPISDNEYYLLKLIQAINHDFANADKPADKVDRATEVDDVEFRFLDPDKKEPTTIPHRDLFALLRKLRDHPKSADMSKKIEIVLEPGDKSGSPQKITKTAGELLGMQEALPKSDLTGYLLKAREMAKITSPNFTYTLLFLVSMIVLWSGCNNAAKEIVKEEAIYGRERAVNLGIVPYLASKFIVLSLFTIVQTAMLMLLVFGPLHLLHAYDAEHFHLPAPEYMLPYPEQFFVLSLLSMAGVALGLLLSACVSNPDRANALLPYVLIPQIILGGAIMPVRRGVMEWLAWIMSPEYWAFRAVRTGETTLPEILASVRMDYDDALWIPCLVLVLETGVMLVVTAWFMRRKDVDRA